MSHPSKPRSGGLLPVNAATAAAASKKDAASQAAAKSAARVPVPKLRLVIRRLPPGLTEDEFWAVLGDGWKVGAGKVDWTAFKEGKISTDSAKPSRPGRAYLRVKEQSWLEELSTVVKESSFHDAKNSGKDACLLGPPSLEFAPYSKIPGGRVRNDARQGTIDQDPEFIDFLQRLTEPIMKPAVNGTDDHDAKLEKVSTTPLIEYIKEKKANKAKEASQAKAAKARENKEAKSAKAESRSTVIIKSKGKDQATADKDRPPKPVPEGAKASKTTVLATGKQTPSKAADAKPPSKDAASQLTPVKRERERGNVSAAARMLQRDLGLLPKGERTPRTPKTGSATSAAETAPAVAPKTTTPAATKPAEPIPPSKHASQKQTSASSTAAPPPTGPRITRSTNATSSKNAPLPMESAAGAAAAATAPKAAKPPQQSHGAKSAFLKHANQSQGITEETLLAVFRDFGTITRCDIDKRKGLGYIDFRDTDSLKKAMAASPVKVANGQVVVMENKQPHAKRAGGQAGQKAGGANAPKATATESTPSTPTTPVAAAASSPNLAATTPPDTTSTPTETPASTPAAAPRATGRGPGSGGRARGISGGGRGGARGASQGPRPGNRGGARGGGKRGGASASGTPNVEADATTKAAPKDEPQ